MTKDLTQNLSSFKLHLFFASLFMLTCVLQQGFYHLWESSMLLMASKKTEEKRRSVFLLGFSAGMSSSLSEDLVFCTDKKLNISYCKEKEEESKIYRIL